MATGKSVYKRLINLFSSDVIVRNIGGSKLKVIDTDRIQSLGRPYANDRFTRMYSSLNYRLSSQQALYGMESQRLRLFRDYEVMDTDPIITSALDIYAEEATMKNEMGDIVRIKAGNSKVRDVLENLLYDILNIEFNLPTWVRGMVKYGDFYLHLELSKDFGVKNVIPLPVYELKRVEGEDPARPNLVKFYMEGAQGKGEFQYFEVAHFRLFTDSNYLPYGKSMVEGARRVWKQLILMEDAMLIHRIMRAPDRRIFKIDVGNIAPAEVDAYMERIISQVKKIPYIDPETGEYNLKFNLQNMTEDFYLPVRGGDSGTDIDTLAGLEYNSIEDIEYLRNKMMASLKIPKAFLGYEEEVGSKATLAAEDVRFARTVEKIQKMIISELMKIALIHLYIQGFKGNDLVDFELELTNPSIIFEQEKLELWATKMNLASDVKDGKILSQDWIYTNIFNMTKDEIIDEKENIIDDIKRQYRLQQIEEEGNDPADTDQGFDSYGKDQDEFGENKKYNLKKEDDGRDGKKARTRKKDEPFGEDPIGQRDYEKIAKLDGELHGAYDGNKKKHLSRKIKQAEQMLGTSVKKTKQLLSEVDMTNIKEYFDLDIDVDEDNKDNKEKNT